MFVGGVLTDGLLVLYNFFGQVLHNFCYKRRWDVKFKVS